MYILPICIWKYIMTFFDTKKLDECIAILYFSSTCRFFRRKIYIENLPYKSQKYITNINYERFIYLKNINLSYYKLAKIPPNIEYLIIENNLVRDLSNFKKLKKLKLSNFYIDKIPSTLEQLTVISTNRMAGGKDKNIDLSSTINLKKLSIKGNILVTNISTTLTSLKITNNNRVSISNLKSLVYLKSQNTSINNVVFPANIIKLELYDIIVDISINLSLLKNIKYLSFGSCTLTYLDIECLSTLEHLEIPNSSYDLKFKKSGNNIGPIAFPKNLTNLNITNNKNILNSDIIHLTKLKILNCTDTLLSEYPTSIIRLSIRNCPTTILDYMKNLKYLDARGTNLISFPDTLYELGINNENIPYKNLMNLTNLRKLFISKKLNVSLPNKKIQIIRI